MRTFNRSMALETVQVSSRFICWKTCSDTLARGIMTVAFEAGSIARTTPELRGLPHPEVYRRGPPHPNTANLVFLFLSSGRLRRYFLKECGLFALVQYERASLMVRNTSFSASGFGRIS